MSLFACQKCGVVENTAVCGLVWERTDTGELIGEAWSTEGKELREQGVEIRRALICSECNPDLRRWHGLFPRQNAEEAGYTQIPGSRYIERKP